MQLPRRGFTAILIGTVTCENLVAARAAVQRYGLAVFGATDAVPLRELQRGLAGNTGSGGDVRFYFCAPT